MKIKLKKKNLNFKKIYMKKRRRKTQEDNSERVN